MSDPSLETLLQSEVRGDLSELWGRYVAEPGTHDRDLFLIWLRDRGEIDEPTTQRLLLLERLDVVGDAASTFGDLRQRADGITDGPKEAMGHTVLSPLGAGAMGEVFLVRDEALRRKVASKHVSARAATNPTLLARFLTEAQITAQLEHPSIIPVYAFDRDDSGAPSYTMKLIQGKTFKQYLKECRSLRNKDGPPDDGHTLEAALEHFLKVCDAMAYAHSRGVLHRDLKPDNIMLGPFGEVVVMDWGIARVMGAEEAELVTLTGLETMTGTSQLTQMGQALGTPAFMSPEQAMGQHESLDGRSDQFSLGLILFELVTLGRAYKGMTPMAVLGLAREAAVPAVVSKVAGVTVPLELAAIVRRATRSQVHERYPDVEALALDLRRFLHGDAVSVLPDSPIQRMSRWLSRHRQVTLSAGIALIFFSIAAVLGGVTAVQLQRVEAEQREVALSKLLGSVAAHAHGVDAQLLRYTALLESLGATARASLDRSPDPSVRIYRSGSYADGGQPPADSFESDRYKQRVSFEHPVIKLAPGVDPQQVTERMQQLMAAGPAFRELFLRSRDEKSARLPRVRADALLRTNSAPVVWAYVAVQEGIHSSYPGHGPYPDAYDPRERPWYRAALEVDGPRWGSPYVDINGLGLILPCNLALRDTSGDLLGVAGLELTFGRVTRDLLVPKGVSGAEEAFLLDHQGKIVVSSSEAGDEHREDEDLTEAAELEPFPVAEVIAAIPLMDSGSVQVGDQLYAWTHLVTIDWTYVVRGPAGVMTH